ncbi:MAG: methyltransferase domain-containing protein [Nitrososphaerota archaeon]|nr:methyltransferase domain-containing protein [Nitrososphaerota archaeon]
MLYILHDVRRKAGMRWTDSPDDWGRFLSTLDPHSGERILDIGAGVGDVAALVLKATPGAEVHAVDPSARKVSLARTSHPSVKSAVAGAERLPFPDSSFDRVYATMALHHFADLDAALKEIARVLKKGGVFIVLEIKPRSARGMLFRFFGRLRGEHMKMMKADLLKGKLASSGLFGPASSAMLGSGYLVRMSRV